MANKAKSADQSLTIARKRRPTPGAWHGLKPTADLLALYDDQGRLQVVFDSARELDILVPDGPDDEVITAHDLAQAPVAEYEVDDHGHTYFIGGDTGAIKIGRSVNVAVRLKDIQACSPIPVRVLAVRPGTSREKVYHRLFAEYRQHGEWFERCPAILAEIDRLTGEVR